MPDPPLVPRFALRPARTPVSGWGRGYIDIAGRRIPDTQRERAAHRDSAVDRMILEILLSIRRAGADLILTYFARDLARLLG